MLGRTARCAGGHSQARNSHFISGNACSRWPLSVGRSVIEFFGVSVNAMNSYDILFIDTKYCVSAYQCLWQRMEGRGGTRELMEMVVDAP